MLSRVKLWLTRRPDESEALRDRIKQERKEATRIRDAKIAQITRLVDQIQEQKQ